VPEVGDDCLTIPDKCDLIGFSKMDMTRVRNVGMVAQVVCRPPLGPPWSRRGQPGQTGSQSRENKEIRELEAPGAFGAVALGGLVELGRSCVSLFVQGVQRSNRGSRDRIEIGNIDTDVQIGPPDFPTPLGSLAERRAPQKVFTSRRETPARRAMSGPNNARSDTSSCSNSSSAT
jgi:hypothetical protein